MYYLLSQFFFGLIILLFSTQKLLGLAKKASQILRISPLIIGITIVALGTSLPEFSVSIISILKHDSGLAMGNIIGSNIVNVLMVLPVGLFIGKFRIGTTKTQQNALILLGGTAIFFLSQFIGSIKFISGIILIGLATLVIIVEYQLGVLGRTYEDSKQFKTLKNGKLSSNIILFGLFLVIGIIAGSLLVVDSVERISLFTGISTTVLGLTLTAIATSMPELLTTIFSQKDNQEKITEGNILGSNIFNLLLIGGVLSLFSNTIAIQTKEWLWLAATTIGFVFIIKHYKDQKPPKWIGVILILFFIAYLLLQ